jgi:hypothetical protein
MVESFVTYLDMQRLKDCEYICWSKRPKGLFDGTNVKISLSELNLIRAALSKQCCTYACQRNATLVGPQDDH